MMKNIAALLVLTFISLSNLNAQTFSFVGERSFLSTETYTLSSNSTSSFAADLQIAFGKEGQKGLIIVRAELASTVRISGKLIIYLEDGTVISCIDRGIKDNVDDVASSVYYLTNEELKKLSNSSINTIRYTIKCEECLANPIYEGNHSASNKGGSKIDFPSVITSFYELD